jgi:hypothetical protein
MAAESTRHWNDAPGSPVKVIRGATVFTRGAVDEIVGSDGEIVSTLKEYV